MTAPYISTMTYLCIYMQDLWLRARTGNPFHRYIVSGGYAYQKIE